MSAIGRVLQAHRAVRAKSLDLQKASARVKHAKLEERAVRMELTVARAERVEALNALEEEARYPRTNGNGAKRAETP